MPREYSKVCFNVCGGAVTVSMLGVMENAPAWNWSFRSLQKPGDENNEENEMLVAKLTELVAERKLNGIYAPSPAQFNSAIVPLVEFSPKDVLWLNGSRFHTPLYRGVHADGIYSEGSERVGFMMSSADCALLVVRSGRKVFVAHAGRNSLFDKEEILSGKPSKKYRSVVDAIMANLSEDERVRAQAFVGCAISEGEHFEHPTNDAKHGDWNAKMITYLFENFYNKGNEYTTLGGNFFEKGQISLSDIITRQLLAYGVRRKWIIDDGRCTYSEKDSDGNHLWYSERRTPGKRNLVFVTVN